MTPTDDASERPTDKAKQQITDALHEVLDPILTPFIAKLATAWATKEGEHVLESLHSPRKVVVQILYSEFKDEKHTVHFKVTNDSLHGAYLESIELVAPQGTFSVKEDFDDVPGIPTPGHHKSSGWKRPHLSPGGDYAFSVTFPACKDPTYTSQWSGMIRLEISQLDQVKPEFREIPFRIRWQ